MYIIPAIDIKNGKCIRLVQGDPNKETIYSDSPVDQAKVWASYNIKRLHIVDLDGAFSGIPKNLDIIKEIRDNISVEIELGGGIRDINTIKAYLNAGIDKVIIGSAAFKNRDFLKEACQRFPDSITVGIDVVNGNVAIHGWKDITDIHFYRFGVECKEYGVKELIITDIKRDGMLSGISPSFYEKALTKIELPIIASGGLSNLDDIKALSMLESKGLIGVITGKALYENKIDLAEAIRVSNVS